MKTFIRRTTLASIAILFLLGGTSAAFANTQNQQNQQKLLLTSSGTLTNLGDATYTMNGGTVAYAYIDGYAVSPGATIQYSLTATQNGLTTNGWGSIRFDGYAPGLGRVSVTGTFNIDDNTPAAVIGCCILPYFLVSDTPNVQLTVGGTPQPFAPQTTFGVESPYFNPFGGPIVLMSTDDSVIIAATYTQGNIFWTGSQVTASVTGTLGGKTDVSGTSVLTTNEDEDLLRGSATDSGTISFSSMTPSSLDAQGSFSGTSTIPWPNVNGVDSYGNPVNCSPAGLPNTCTETGFQSHGRFSAGPITGSYSSGWTVPALAFTSTTTATVSQYGNH